MKKILLPIAVIAFFAGGFLLARFWYAPAEEETTQENATVLLEKIKTVAKLVTVEGYFSEVYDYKDYWQYDLPFLRKKALLRVKATVSVGYDLGQMKVEVRPDEQRIFISNLPDPQIIAIDHTLDYYDISEGAFNSFSETDYNRLNQNAKSFIRSKAEQSDLMLRAEQQGVDLLEVIEFMAENAGWEVNFVPRQELERYKN